MIFGAYFTTQAQMLGAKVTNNSTVSWDFRAFDSSAPPFLISLGSIAPGATVSGSVAGPVNLPFTCQAGETGNACAQNWNITGAPSFGSLTICGTVVSWRCEYSALIPAGYSIYVTIN